MAHEADLAGGSVWTAGPFRILPQQKVILRGDRPIQLGGRAKEILFTLIERAGELVSKEELTARVWPNISVEDATLRVHIAALRKALGDSRSGIRYIQNVSGRGYRFAASLIPSTLDHPPPQSQVAPPTRVQQLRTPLTRVIGRSDVINALAQLLPKKRLITIVGAAGVGKTTVAVALAEQCGEAYRHGTLFVELGLLSDPLLVPSAVASALGLSTPTGSTVDSLAAYLQNKQMLIVLDNCEHVVLAAASLVETLLKSTAEISFVATSREPLRAEGEWVRRLASLDCPPQMENLTSATALGYPAVELFVERAMASDDEFRLEDADTLVVAELCRKLEGNPLAIELAAARVHLFGLRGLLAHLDDRLQLLTTGRRTTSPRHKSLRATLDWSYELLHPAEQQVLRRLAVFAGGFDLSSAVAIASDNSGSSRDAIEHLSNLVEKSLLSVNAWGEDVLYRLLETTKVYAREKLEESNESPIIRRRLAELCCDWYPREANWQSHPVPTSLALHARRVDDVRAALEWCFSPQGDASIGARLAAASAPLWFQLSLIDEYRMRLERAHAAHAAILESDPALIVDLWTALGHALMHTKGLTLGEETPFNRALEIAEQIGVHHPQALWGLWLQNVAVGDYQSCAEVADRFATVCEDLVAEAAMLRAESYEFCGDHAAARKYAERARQLSTNRAPSISWQDLRFLQPLSVIARALWIQGFPEKAARVAAENLAESAKAGHAVSVSLALVNCCILALWSGDNAAARPLAKRLSSYATEHSLAYWQFWARCFEVEIALRCGEGDLELGRDLVNDPLCNSLRAEFLGTFNEYLVDDGHLARVENGGSGWCSAEILRAIGEAMLRRGDVDATTKAEAMFKRSLDIARQQQALSWELRSATSLATLWRDQGCARHAHELLSSTYARFTEGFHSGDLQRAKCLIGSFISARPQDCDL